MISVNLKFPGERLAQFTISYGANPMSQYRIVGTEGDLEVSPGFTWQQGLTHTLTIGEKKTTKTYGKSDHFGGETKYFSNCVLDDQHPEPDGEEGLADVRVIKAIEESLQTGKPVSLPPGPVRKQRPDARADHEVERGSSGQDGRRRASRGRHEVLNDAAGATGSGPRRFFRVSGTGSNPVVRPCALQKSPVASACSRVLLSSR